MEGNARPLRYDVEDVFFVHLDALFLASRAPLLQDGFKPFFGVLFLVPHRGSAFKILVLYGPLLLGLDLFDLALESFDFRRPRHRSDACA